MSLVIQNQQRVAVKALLNQPTWYGGTFPIPTWSTRKSILVLGDSISEGYAAGATETTRVTTGYVGQLRTYLQSIHGDGGLGWIPPWHSKWVKVGTWTKIAFSFYGFGYYAANDNTKTLTLSVTDSDNVDLYWADVAQSGDFTYTVDGGSPITVTALKDGQRKTINIDFGSIGSHSITITAPAVGWVLIVGASAYKGTTGLVVHNASRAGAQTATLLATSSESLVPVIPTVNPDLVITVLGVNDFQGQIALNTFQANLEAIANIVLTNCPYIQIMPLTVDVEMTIKQNEYEDRIKTVAEADGMAWINLAAKNGVFNADLMEDVSNAVHPNLAGHTVMANDIISIPIINKIGL